MLWLLLWVECCVCLAPPRVRRAVERAGVRISLIRPPAGGQGVGWGGPLWWCRVVSRVIGVAH